MKRITKFIMLILSVLTALVFAGCSDYGAPDHSVSQPDYAVTPAELSDILRDFLTECPDRTSFKTGEDDAAVYLSGALSGYGYGPEIKEVEDLTEDGVSGLTTRHVIAKLKSGAENASNVVIAAYYDNRCSAAYANANFTSAEGALSNGTGVAGVLGIAKYLKENGVKLDFDVTFVFMGGSFVSSVGAKSYFEDVMTAEERNATVLMIELQRLGCDNVYAFCDDRETSREKFLDGVAKDSRLNVYKPTQKSPLILDITAMNGVPYYRWAHTGVFGPFFNAGIPTVNIVGANWETLNMLDIESASHGNITATKNDTLKTLEEYYPDYADKIATAASLVVRSLENPNFLKTMKADKQDFPDTGVLTKSWIWQLVAIGFLLLAAAAVYGIAMYINKKNPPAAPKQLKKFKMAVFGMDYEDKDENSIYIDIKNADGDIFPGVPNNARDPYDGIFSDVPPAQSSNGGGNGDNASGDGSDGNGPSGGNE